MNTTIDLGIYFLLTHVLFFADFPVFAKAFSYGCGIVNSFFWNRAWTFRSKRTTGPGLLYFFLVNLAALGLNTGMMYAGLTIFHTSNFLALTLATAAPFLLNFFVSKHVVFPK